MAALPLLYIIADSAEKIGPSIQCRKYELSIKAVMVMFFLALTCTAGLGIIHLPFFFMENACGFLLSIPLMILLVGSIFLYTGLNMLAYISVNNLKSDCKAQLTKDIMKLEDVQEIVDNYERINHGLSMPAFTEFSSIILGLILALYIGLSG